ncbi:neuropeptide prohormone-4-like [Physella acuta]|uniref:neuropeptide prohormone-4-like n=1 Tax=Physella acuta TaxID=109671 RepID=UPI0027DCB8E6|nr:neuropeptide prohormone-4-like [Physella acuta]
MLKITILKNVLALFVIATLPLADAGNTCPAGKPFMCRSSPTCIALKFICDKNYDCEDGSDEDPADCLASHRPDTDFIFNLIDHEKKWMLPKLFNGAAPLKVAHALREAADMEELRLTLGLTDENVQNLRTAFTYAVEGDERPLMAMGMEERQWHEVQRLFEEILNSGFLP